MHSRLKNSAKLSLMNTPYIIGIFVIICRNQIIGNRLLIFPSLPMEQSRKRTKQANLSVILLRSFLDELYFFISFRKKGGWVQTTPHIKMDLATSLNNY